MEKKFNESRSFLEELMSFPGYIQVISPQRITATIGPELLLSPNMFTQAMSNSALLGFPQESSLTQPPPQHQPQQDRIPVLSKSQLQATLLNLIQVELLSSSLCTSRRHFWLHDGVFIFLLLSFCRRTANSWTASTKPTPAALPTTPAANDGSSRSTSSDQT